MPIIPGLRNIAAKLGSPGKTKKYDVTPTPDAFQNMSVTEKLQALSAYYRFVNREQRIRRHTTWYLMGLYYQGYQNVDLNPNGQAFDIYEREDFYVENQFRRHVDTVKNILNKNEGDITIRPASDKPQDLAVARFADAALELMKGNIGYDRLRDQKNLYKALFGNAFIFSDYIVDKKYGTIVSPKYNYNEVDDGMGGQIMSKIQDGFTTRVKGQEMAMVCSPLEINVRADVKGGMDNQPYLQWITGQDIELLNYIYPGLNVSAGESSATQDLARQYMEILGNLPGNILGDSLAYNRGGEQLKKGELVRSWFTPSTFRADKELLKQFPDGVHVVTVNGIVVDFYPEKLTDRWTHELLIPLPHSFLGDGLYDAILMQDQINEMDSLMIKHMRYDTVGHKLYNPQCIDPRDVVNDPENGWIPVKTILDQPVASAVTDLNPNPLSPDVVRWIAMQKEAMQDMTGAYDPEAGKAIGANTPYSQSVFLADKAQGRWRSSAKFNSVEVKHFHRQLLDIAKNNWLDERTAAMIDNTGEWSFQKFSQADLQGEVDIILSDTDMKPRSRAEQVQALETLVALAPVLGALPPKQKLRAEEMLGLPPDANPMTGQIARAYRTIDRLRQGDDQLHPLPLVDDPQAQVPVFQDFLASEDGEQLAEAEPEIYSNIYMYMMTLAQMGMMQAGMGAPPAAGGPPQPGQPPDKPGTPGGQPGQKGGGKPPDNTAQSPAPAPPISPAAA